MMRNRGILSRRYLGLLDTALQRATADAGVRQCSTARERDAHVQQVFDRELDRLCAQQGVDRRELEIDVVRNAERELDQEVHVQSQNELGLAF